MSTIFQKIIDGEISANVVYEDSECIVIHDVAPQAPIHMLVIPKRLIPRVGLATEEDQQILGKLLLVAGKIANSENLDGGFRIVINNGADGGESVPHLHVHVLGGRAMKWPPG